MKRRKGLYSSVLLWWVLSTLNGCVFAFQSPKASAPIIAYYLIEETGSGDTMWIATSDPEMDAALQAYPEGTSWWLMGRVVEDPAETWGFTFDPGSLELAEFTIEMIQTTIRQIAADPASYASASWPWAIGLYAVRDRVPVPFK